MIRFLLKKILNFKESLNNYYQKHGFFPNWHIWDFKTCVAYFIIPRIKAYRHMVVERQIKAIPNWVLKNEDDCIDKLDKDVYVIWEEYLNEIIFAFEYTINPLKFSHLNYEEALLKKNKGLFLFALYYDHLWD